MRQRSLQRHDLVWLDPKAAAEITVFDPAYLQSALEWIGSGYPLVVSRQQPQGGEGEGRLSLGFTLPPPRTRHRVALSVPRETVIRHAPPIGLDEGLEHAPLWRERMRGLGEVCRHAGATPYVYGSLSWQALTGKRYLTPKSDLDVLFACDDNTNIAHLLASLRAFDGDNPRLDGEIVTSAGWATAWREVAAANAGATKGMMAKSLTEVRILAIVEFLGPMAPTRGAVCMQ